MRDASLDEFLSSSGKSEADESASEVEPEAVEKESGPEPESEREDEQEVAADLGSDTETNAEEEDPPPAADVDPARSTYAWSPDGATCAACGERVEERWESEAGLVCVECKEW